VRRPFGHRLLGVDPDRSRALSDLSGLGWAGIKPGWVRLSFNYFVDDRVAGFLVEAVDLLATSGHRLLGDYRFAPRSGHWRHRDAPPDPVLSLPDLLDGRPGPGTVTAGYGLAGQLERARALLEPAEPAAPEAGPSWLPTELERLRDFHLPATAWSRPPAGGRYGPDGRIAGRRAAGARPRPGRPRRPRPARSRPGR
jgi:hypothetical protein